MPGMNVAEGWILARERDTPKLGPGSPQPRSPLVVGILVPLASLGPGPSLGVSLSLVNIWPSGPGLLVS